MTLSINFALHLITSRALHRALPAALALSLGAAAPSSWAQDSARTALLKGDTVTEANLLDALTPPPEVILTRGLRIGRVSHSEPAGKPSASLLITFETNSAQLTPAAKQQLDVVAAALKNDRLTDYTFNVEGHADPRGSSENNMTLSQLRAESVREFLISVHGIAHERLHAQGKGDLELMNRGMPSAPENRRVTIVTNAVASAR